MVLIHQFYFLFWTSFTIVNPLSEYPVSLSSFADRLTNNVSFQSAISLGAIKCPFMNFCTREQTMNSSQYVFSTMIKPCCTQCSCKWTCRFSRNCCVDARWSREGYTEELFSQMVCETSFLQNRHKRERLWFFRDINYIMVDTCPESDGTLVPCKMQMNSTKSISDMIKDNTLVSSQDGRVIFRNEYCARCNNVTNFVRWSASVAKCRDDLFKLPMPRDALLNYVMDNCLVLSKPPAEFKTEEFQCKREDDFLISECNVTGEWDKFDPDIQMLCMSAQYTPVYQTKWGPYSNVFCMLCNTPEGQNLSNICIFAGDVILSLGYILELELFGSLPSELKSSDQSTYLCKEDEVLDPFFNVCRRLECPFQRIPTNGVCNNHHFDGKDIYFILSFKLSFVENTTLVVHRDIDHDVIDIEQFFGQLNITSCNYLQTKSKFYFSTALKFLEYLSLEIYVHRTNTCAENVLNHLLYTSDSSVCVPVALFNQILYGTLELNIPVTKTNNNGSTYDIFPLPDNTELFLSFNDSNKAIAYKGPPEGMPCPYMILDEADYFTLFENQTRKSLHESYNLNELSVDTMLKRFVKRMYYVGNHKEFLYFICLDDYLPVKHIPVNPEGTESILKDTKGLLTLILACLSMLSLIICTILFCLSGKTKSVPSKVFVIALINLCVAQGLFQFGVDKIDTSYFCCVLIGIFTHYAWLSAIFALNAYCVLVATKITSFDGIKVFRVGEMVKSVVYIYGLPCTFVSINILFTWIRNGRIGYGRYLCYIDTAVMRAICFALPILLTVIINCFVNAYIILKTRQTAISAGRRLNETKNASVFFRLMLLSGLAWIFGFLNEIYSSIVLQYCFIVSIAGQGTFLLVVFHFDRIPKLVRKVTMSTAQSFTRHTCSNERHK